LSATPTRATSALCASQVRLTPFRLNHIRLK
jgi:hypothetical protein